MDPLDLLDFQKLVSGLTGALRQYILTVKHKSLLERCLHVGNIIGPTRSLPDRIEVSFECKYDERDIHFRMQKLAAVVLSHCINDLSPEGSLRIIDKTNRISFERSESNMFVTEDEDGFKDWFIPCEGNQVYDLELFSYERIRDRLRQFFIGKDPMNILTMMDEDHKPIIEGDFIVIKPKSGLALDLCEDIIREFADVEEDSGSDEIVCSLKR